MRSRERFAEQRKKTGYSQEELASALGVSPSTVARWEQGHTEPVARHRRALAELWGLPLAEVNWLLEDRDEPVATYGGGVVPWLGHYASLEQSAGEKRAFEPLFVTGLLQTRAYAEALGAAHYRPVGRKDIEQMVEARLARQAVLRRSPDPLRLRCVIDESVLLREVGSRETMGEQLDHLAASMRHPNITLRVAPLSNRMNGAAFGRFDLLSAARSDAPYVACTEDLAAIRYHDAVDEVSSYNALFEHLWSQSLDAVETVRRIETHRRASSTGHRDSGSVDVVGG